jgi:hypothetical protein
MKELNNYTIYTVEDIHKYFTGKLSSVEMYTMERAALNDPLLADAMEGYKESGVLENEKSFFQLQYDLTLLKKKISNKNNHFKDNNWWKIAASFLLLTSACFAFYLVSHNNKLNEAGLIQQPVLKPQTVKDRTAFIDKKTPPPSISEQEEIPLNSPAKSKIEKNNPAAKKTALNNATTPLSPKATESVSAASEDMIYKKNESAFAKDNNTSRLSLAKKSLLKKDTSDDNAKTESQVYLLYKSDAEPLIGWSTYLHYLQNQLSYSTYDNGRPVTGEMIIEFKIDPTNNTPVNFDFEKSIDADVNNAVQELILNGPQWKKINNTPVTGIVRLKIIF